MLYRHGSATSFPLEIFHFCSFSNSGHCLSAFAARMGHKRIQNSIRRIYCQSQRKKRMHKTHKQTFTDELDSIERMLRQIELSLIAGDHEPYKTSASPKIHRISCYQTLKDRANTQVRHCVCFLPKQM